MTLFKEVTCCVCGLEFGMTSGMHKQREDDNRTFYCPNGHAQSYTESELDKVRKQLESEQRNSRNMENLALSRERSMRSLRGVITRVKKG